MAAIELAQENGFVVLTINRPQARNALTWEAMQAFSQAVASLKTNPRLTGLILTGAGGAFCSGGDLVQLHDYPTYEDGLRLSRLMGDALLALEELPFPTVAAIEGAAMGGGAEIALACDVRIMAQDARMGLMHIRLGICPAWGGLERLARLAGYARSLEWLAAGAVIDAQQAAQHGLANQVVPPGQALAAAKSWLVKVGKQDPQAVRSIKALLRRAAGEPDGALLEEARRAFARLWAAPSHHKASQAFMDAKEARTRSRA